MQKSMRGENEVTSAFENMPGQMIILALAQIMNTRNQKKDG